MKIIIWNNGEWSWNWADLSDQREREEQSRRSAKFSKSSSIQYVPQANPLRRLIILKYESMFGKKGLKLFIYFILNSCLSISGYFFGGYSVNKAGKGKDLFKIFKKVIKQFWVLVFSRHSVQKQGYRNIDLLTMDNYQKKILLRFTVDKRENTKTWRPGTFPEINNFSGKLGYKSLFYLGQTASQHFCWTQKFLKF